MYCRPSKVSRSSMGTGQRGAALIVALLVFALAAALMVGLQRDFTLQMQRGGNGFVIEQGWAYLRGAEDLAATALRFDVEQDGARESPRDDLTEIWAIRNAPYALDEGGWLVGELEDLQGRFNLNLLVDDPTVPGGANDGEEGNPEGTGNEDNDDPGEVDGGIAPQETGVARFSAPQRQLIRLLQTFDNLEIAQEQAIAITEAIADFIDADDQPRLEGAEDDAYRNATPPYRTANQPMASVSELRAVRGITPEIYQALAPLVTVWPISGGKLNIHTALPAVLRSLNVDERLEPLPLGDAQRLLEMRNEGELTDIDTLLGDVVFSDGATDGLREHLTERSDWFLLSATVEIADRELRLYSVLERQGRTIQSRYRSQGEL